MTSILKHLTLLNNVLYLFYIKLEDRKVGVVSFELSCET